MSAFSAAMEAFKQKDYTQAVSQAGQAIEENPNDFKAWELRGILQAQIGNFYSSVLNYDKTISLNTDWADVFNNRGLAYISLDLCEEALQDLERAIELNPTEWKTHLALGLLYANLSHYDAAEYHFREATTLGDSPAAHISLGTLLLGTGRWKEGFKEDQYRYKLLNTKFLIPNWKGEDLNGKHLVLFTEGGNGDVILSLRYIDAVKQKYPNAKITVRASDDMIGLVESSFDVKSSKVVPGADYVSSLLDVPMILEMTWDTVPRPNKYLLVDDLYAKKWRPRLRNIEPGLKVGLCWHSYNGKGKSFPAEAIEELNLLPNAQFVSLQKPYKRTYSSLKLHDWTDEIENWQDTAALTDGLDLVISVDSAVAHLAGALGKPVYAIPAFAAYWPWMVHDIPPTPRHSIWYPSMQLFRQRRINDWLLAMRRVILTIQREVLGLT